MTNGAHVGSVEALLHFRGTIAQIDLGVADCFASSEHEAVLTLDALDALIARTMQRAAANDADREGTDDRNAEFAQAAQAQGRLEELAVLRRLLTQALEAFQDRRRSITVRMADAVERANAFLGGRADALGQYTPVSPVGAVSPGMRGSLATFIPWTSPEIGWPVRSPIESPPSLAGLGGVSFPTLGTGVLNLSTTGATGVSPGWAYREGIRMLLGFSTVSPAGALPWLGTAPTPTTSFLELELTTSGKWARPFGLGTTPAPSYDLKMSTGPLSVGHSAFEYAPSISVSACGASPSLASGGGLSAPCGSFGGYGFGGGMGGVGGFGGGFALGS